MPWPRDEPDPLRAKRRQLAEQERELAERMSRLHQELQEDREAAKKPPEPPVWRLEDEQVAPRAPETTSAKPRHLARQTQRDKIFFFIFMALLLVLVVIFFWVYQVHLRAATE
jgi:hypothetical protein